MPSNKPWLGLADIAENARQILNNTRGVDFADFIVDRKTCNASERCLMRISEAAIKLGSFAEDLLPSHDWRSIRGMGNILRHDYDQVSLPMVWNSIGKSLVPLLDDFEAAIAARDATEN